MRILRRDMLKNLEDAKASNHKKNKSESHISKPNRREFSMFDMPMKQQHQRQKKSKQYQVKEEDFFEFPGEKSQREESKDYN